MSDLDVRVQWHAPDEQWVAVLLRDGAAWFLDGALVGSGQTRGKAVDHLIGVATYLVTYGENFLTEAPLSTEDRLWLFRQLDQGNDALARHEMYIALRELGVTP